MGEGKVSVPPMPAPATGFENPLTESLARLGQVLRERDEKDELGRKLVREIIDRTPGDSYTSKVTQALFTYWADSYDGEMIVHETAIRRLISMVSRIQPMLRHPIFRGRTLEMSCGTGMVIDAIWNSVGESERNGMNFVANDITYRMLAKAYERFRRMPEEEAPYIDFKNQDIRVLDAQGIFDTAILSQTLHLITDERHIKKEDQGDTTAGSEHLKVKKRVIRRAFESLRDNGHFILIDEWPEILTDKSDPVKTELFNRTTRRVNTRKGFMEEIMAQIKGTRLVCELKANIDFKHSMYLVAYKKDRDKIDRRRKDYCDDDEEMAFAATRVRDKLIETDRFFVDSFSPAPEGWVELIPMGHGNLRTVSTPTLDFQPADLIVLDRVMHNVEDDFREKMINRAVEAVTVGGALMIIDDWHPKPDRYSNPISRTYLRNHMKTDYEGTLIFQGAYREPIGDGFDNGMTGFMYRKKDD